MLRTNARSSALSFDVANSVAGEGTFTVLGGSNAAGSDSKACAICQNFSNMQFWRPCSMLTIEVRLRPTLRARSA